MLKRSDQSSLGGHGPGPDAELAVDAREVPTEGLWAEVEPLRHLLVGESLSDEPQDLDLAGRQHVLGNLWGGVRLERPREDFFERYSPTFIPQPRELSIAQRYADGVFGALALGAFAGRDGGADGLAEAVRRAQEARRALVVSFEPRASANPSKTLAARQRSPRSLCTSRLLRNNRRARPVSPSRSARTPSWSSDPATPSL